MTNQKNRFFTLVFSCCPGAGEMYMGLYRQGVRKCTPKHRRVFGFVLLLIALSELWKQAMYLMERFFYIPDFAWALSHTVPQIVVAVVILVVALRLMREPKDEETEEADEQAEETDEQEIAEAIAEEENKEM